MFAKIGNKLFHTLTGRLALTYTLASGGLLSVMLIILFVGLKDSINELYDSAMSAYGKEIETLYLQNGLERFKTIIDESEDEDPSEGYYQILSKDRQVLMSTDTSGWPSIASEESIFVRIQEEKQIAQTRRLAEIPEPIRILYQLLPDGNVLMMVVPKEEDRTVLVEYTQFSIILVVVMLVCGGGIGWFLARSAMAGVKQITATAVRIGDGQLQERVPSSNHPEEIKQLAETFNRMVDRVNQLIQELKDVSNNVAHDLRSPLTRIRGNVEVTLRGASDLEDYQAMSAKVIDECDHLEGMINTILDIAALDAGLATIEIDSIDLKAIIIDAEDLFAPLAESKQQTFHFDLPIEPIYVLANRSRLQRVVANLLDNAIKFTPEGGSIQVTLQHDEVYGVLQIQDSGMGIAPDDLPHIFKPYYRGDKSRSQVGNGLGLSYVRAVIDNHNGTIQANCPSDGGTIFHVQIPKSQ